MSNAREAQRIVRAIRDRLHNDFGVCGTVTYNRTECKVHGYAPDAFAAISYEGPIGPYDSLSQWNAYNPTNFNGLFVEAQTGWLLAVYTS